MAFRTSSSRAVVLSFGQHILELDIRHNLLLAACSLATTFSYHVQGVVLSSRAVGLGWTSSALESQKQRKKSRVGCNY